MRRSFVLFVVLLNFSSALPTETLSAASISESSPSFRGNSFETEALSNPDLLPFEVAPIDKPRCVLRAQVLHRLGRIQAMRHKPERPNILNLFMRQDDQRILISAVQLLKSRKDFAEARRFLMSFGARGDDSITNRNRFRAVATCLAATLVNQDPELRERAEAVLSDFIRLQGDWVVEPASAQTPRLTAEEFVLMRITTWIALPWPGNNPYLLYLYRDLWPKDLEGLSEANPSLQLPDRVRSMETRCEYGRSAVERIFAVVSEAGRLPTASAWAQAFPSNLAPIERGFYQTAALTKSLSALQKSIQRAIQASRDISGRQSEEIDNLEKLIKKTAIQQRHISLDQITAVVRAHGKARALQFADLMKGWKAPDTAAFLEALARTETVEVYQRELESLAMQAAGVSLALGPAKFPWKDLSLAQQINLCEAQGTKRLAELARAEPEFSPPELLPFLHAMAGIESPEDPYPGSIRQLVGGAKNVEAVLVQFDYPWSKISLQNQIALATATSNQRLGLAKRLAPAWNPDASVAAALNELDAPKRNEVIAQPADPVAPHKSVLKKGSRVYWKVGVAGATISNLAYMGGQNPDIIVYVRVPAQGRRDRATITMESLADMQKAGVPTEQLRISALAVLEEAHFEEIPPHLSEKYPFLLKSPKKAAGAKTREAGAAPAAPRRRVDLKEKKSRALWQRLVKWAAEDTEHWVVLVDPPLEGELWLGATIGFIHEAIQVPGEEEAFFPTVTYTADADGEFGRYDYIPAGIGRFKWPSRVAQLLSDVDKELRVGKAVNAREFGSSSHIDPHIAIATWQVVKMTRALGGEPEAARQAFHAGRKNLQALFGFDISADLAATLQKLHFFTKSELEPMQRAIRAKRKGRNPIRRGA